MNSIVTVTDAAQTQDLTRLETVKLELGLTANGEDDQIRVWIRQASSIIDGYLNRTLALESVSESFRPDHRLPSRPMPSLRLSRFPIDAIVSVTEDGVLLTTSDYEADADNAMLWRLSDGKQAYWATANIVVAYSAGYDLLDGLPHEIERACISIVKMLRSHAHRDPFAKRVEIPDVRTVDYWVGQVGAVGSVPPEVTSILDGYLDQRV